MAQGGRREPSAATGRCKVRLSVRRRRASRPGEQLSVFHGDSSTASSCSHIAHRPTVRQLVLAAAALVRHAKAQEEKAERTFYLWCLVVEPLAYRHAPRDARDRRAVNLRGRLAVGGYIWYSNVTRYIHVAYKFPPYRCGRRIVVLDLKQLLFN